MSNYNELIRRIPEWMYAQNRDLTNEVEELVSKAHNQIINLLDHDLFRTTISGKSLTAASDGVLDLSAESPRVLEIRSIRIDYNGTGGYTPIMRRDLEMLTMLFASNTAARPRFYAEYSGPLVIKAFPAPDVDYDIEVTANVEPPVLAPSQQTNIISTQHYRVIETATFRQAALYMRDWAAAEEYAKELGSAITEANAAIQRRKRDETDKRPQDASNVMGS